MTTQETLAKYLTDMYAAEAHVVQPLRGFAKDDDINKFGEAKSIVERLVVRTDNAMSGLEILSKEFGADARGGIKSAVTAAAGVAADAIAHTRTHSATKKLRDAYTALSLLAVGYELLHASGNALKSPQVASLALKHLKDVAGFIMEISQSIIPVAVAELAETNSADASTVVLSQSNIENAWRSQASS